MPGGMMRTYFYIVTVYCAVIVTGRPMITPDFVSTVFDINARPGKQNRIDVYHGLGAVPAFVQVQVISADGANEGFVFPAIGVVPRDDDRSDPYSGIVYLYNHVKVTISALVRNNNKNDGRAIYTEQSDHWVGPNSQSSYSAKVRVRAWKLSSFPKPDFYLSGKHIESNCPEATDCYLEPAHDLQNYPSMAVVRTKLDAPGEPFHGYMSDAVGASLMAYDDVHYTINGNGYLIYGFNESNFRIWLASSKIGAIFAGVDGSIFGSMYKEGELEILAWKTTTLTPSDYELIQLGAIPGSEFEQEKHIDILADTKDIILNAWVEVLSGSNKDFRFPASGSMSYSYTHTAKPCGSGGLVYGYTNSTIRFWKPAEDKYGKMICIADLFAGGINSQASNDGQAVVHIWIPLASNLGKSCLRTSDCLDANTVCKNGSCSCRDGYHISDGKCEKVLTCADMVPSIPDLERRGRNYFVNTDSETEKPVDDSFMKASWYKAANYKGNFLIPDLRTPPAERSCGTVLPIYINETEYDYRSLTETPTVVKTCSRNCTLTFDIEIRKCNGSIQYNIAPTPHSSSAFCFDPPEIQGQQDFEAAPAASIGRLAVKVDLMFNETPSNSNANVMNYLPYLVFNCSTTKIMTEPGPIFYTTYWFIDSKLVVAYGPHRNIEPLFEPELLKRGYGLGIHIKCGIRLSKSEIGLMSDMKTSDELFTGIKVHNTSVIIKKGGNAKVYFEPTVPIGCKYSNQSAEIPCKHDLDMMHPEFNPEYDTCYSDVLLSKWDTQKCGSDMKTLQQGESWKPSQLYKFEITTQDIDFSDSRMFKLQLRTSRTGHDIWRNYQVEDVMVIVTYSGVYKHKLCYSHVDPHMQTADGYKYENQYPGEFVLYRNTEYGIEVQEKTTVCNRGRAYCACAVAIRAGADVFLINTCGRLKFIGFTFCGDNGIIDVRKRTELRYQVYTPIGTYIDIQLRPHPGYYDLMNIDIHMAPKDLENTEGLCGYFDNNYRNDLRKRDRSYIRTKNARRNYHPEFSNEWRIKSADRNFLKLEQTFVPTWQMEYHNLFCVCEKALKNSTDKDVKNATALCSPSLFLNCSKGEESVTATHCDRRNRIKRSLSNLKSLQELKRRSLLADQQNVEQRQKRNTDESQITEEDATKHCTSIINEHATVKEFKDRLKGFDPENAIKECAFDVSEGNDLSWANIYPDIMNHVVESNNKRDPVYGESHKEEVARFKLQSCPLNCNNNGNCSAEGTCVCNNGFHGADCSIDEAGELTIDDIEGDGLCDTRDGSTCICFNFQTLNLLDQFSCKITERKNLNGGGEDVFEPLRVSGSYENIFSGECCVPSTRNKRSTSVESVFITQYDIAISNDGLHFGKAQSVYKFDSTCQQFVQYENGSYAFSLKENSCFINNRCIEGNETQHTDICHTCLPAVNTYNWTNITKNPCKHCINYKYNTKQVKGKSSCSCVQDQIENSYASLNNIVYGICGAIVACIIVIGVTYWIHKTIIKPNKSVADSAIFSNVIRTDSVYKYPPPKCQAFGSKRKM